MKLLFFICLIGGFFSCGGNSESDSSSKKNILENLKVSIDSIRIDVGEEIFNAGAYYGSTLSADEKIGYRLYDPKKEIHEYDLEGLKLRAIHPFESDGPNAIPDYVNYFQSLPNEEFFMANDAQAGVFSLSGENKLKLKIQRDNVSGFDPEASFSFANNMHISPDKKKIISLPNTFTGPVVGLAVIDIESMAGKLRAIPALDLTNGYNITFQQGNGITRSGDFHTLQIVNDQFVIYSGATSDIYTYDWNTDSLKLRTFPHQLVAKAKTGDFPTVVDSNERRWELGKEMRKQITFDKFYWDESRKQYFRLGSVTNEDDSIIYLFAYDEEFNLQGETELAGLENIPYQTFFRNGKLFSYYTVEENPALIQFTFDF
jgi:hypothetical protein